MPFQTPKPGVLLSAGTLMLGPANRQFANWKRLVKRLAARLNFTHARNPGISLSVSFSITDDVSLIELLLPELLGFLPHLLCLLVDILRNWHILPALSVTATPFQRLNSNAEIHKGIDKRLTQSPVKNQPRRELPTIYRHPFFDEPM